MRAKFLTTLFATSLFAAPASAAIILVDASSIQGDNVLFNMGVQTGATVMGHTQAGTDVWFNGQTTGGGTIIRANGGQARVEGTLNGSTPQPNDTVPLNSIFFELDGGSTFDNAEFNINGADANATVDFTLIDNLGAIYMFNDQALGNGSNFFGFQGTNGNSIASVSLALDSNAGFNDLRQIRLDEVPPVPEPVSWALMILGFGLVGGFLRARRANIGVTYSA